MIVMVAEAEFGVVRDGGCGDSDGGRRRYGGWGRVGNGRSVSGGQGAARSASATCSGEFPRYTFVLRIVRNGCG